MAIQLVGHDLRDESFIHTDYQAPLCACWDVHKFPEVTIAADMAQQSAIKRAYDGRVCANCGSSEFLSTGTCHTCNTCGTSDGCG